MKRPRVTGDASPAMSALVQDIQELESRAHCLHMYITAHGLNRAKNAAGWEMAGDLLAAGKAINNKRIK